MLALHLRRTFGLIEDDPLLSQDVHAVGDTFVPTQQIVDAVVARVEDRAEAGGVELFVQRGPGGVHGDAGALAEALGNVVLNAIEEAPAGGAVFVATYSTADGSQLWTVQDTGSG